MLPIPEFKSLVDGFQLNITAFPMNVAEGGKGVGSHLLEDGFLKVRVENTGKNLFWPLPYVTVAIILRLKNIDSSPQIHSEYQTCLLGPDDSPIFIELAEKEIESRGGVWLEVLCESPIYPEKDDYLSFGFQLDTYKGVGNA